MYLYKNSILKLHWKENKQGVRVGMVTKYYRGQVEYCQQFKDIWKDMDYHRLVNTKKGIRMEIWSARTQKLKYFGQFNKELQRDGWGIEYDEDSGEIVLEGIWNKGTLIKVIRLFDGDTMVELKSNENDNLNPLERIPVYTGGFRYDENTETFAREGQGCLINGNSGIAVRAGEWKEGKEVSGRDLIDGWYSKLPEYISEELDVPINRDGNFPVYVRVGNDDEMSSVNLKVTDLMISANCGNSFNQLNFSQFAFLRSIEIGNDCFESVQTFKIDGLNRLKTIKIGSNSFTQAKNADGNNKAKSFHVLNCKSLESIEIGRYSFSDFAGDFELKNLPQLCEIKIGDLTSRSCNFSNGSFVIKGLEWFGMRQFVDLPHLRSIQLGFQAFNQPLTTVLESIQYENCRAIHRSASITIDYPRRLFSCWNAEQFLLFVNYERYKEGMK